MELSWNLNPIKYYIIVQQLAIYLKFEKIGGADGSIVISLEDQKSYQINSYAAAYWGSVSAKWTALKLNKNKI